MNIENIDFETESLEKSDVEIDRRFAKDVRINVGHLFEKAKMYLIPELNTSSSIYKKEPILNGVSATGSYGTRYEVILQMYFPEQENYFWWVKFLTPASEQNIKMFGFKYQPIQLGRDLE